MVQDEITTKTLSESFANVKAKTMTAFIHAHTQNVFCFKEHLKELLTILFWNANSLVGYPYVDAYVVLRVINDKLIDRNLDSIITLGKLDRIVDQVYQNLLHANFVNLDDLVDCIYEA